MHPTTGTFISLVVSFVLIMALTLAFDLDGLRAIPAIAFGWLAVQGVLNFLMGRFLNMTGVSLAGASRATPVVAMSPLFAAVFAFLFLGERPTLLLVVGTLSVITGVALIVRESLRDAQKNASGDKKVLLGSLLALGAAVAYGVNNVITREVVSIYTTPLAAASIALLFGAVYLFPISFRSLPELRWVPRGDIRFIALSGAAAGIGNTSMFFALSKVPVVVAAPIGAVNPLVALLLSHIFLKRLERVTASIVVGTLLVVGGVVLVILGRNL